MQKRLTRQKKDIIDSIGSFETFFTADDLFDSVAKKNDDIGIATVYRFLNDERKNGRIHSYSCGRKTLYSRNRTNHCHFVCSVCGKTRHIDIEKIDFLKRTSLVRYAISRLMSTEFATAAVRRSDGSLPDFELAAL